MKLIFFFLIIGCPCMVSAQTYRTTSQGKNYGNGGAYVAPVITKTYTIKPPAYSAPVRNLPSATTSSTGGFSAGKQKNTSGGVYDTAISRSVTPKSSEDFRYLGISKYTREEYEEAIEYYNKAIALDSRNEQAYLGIGLSKYKLNDYAGSIPAFTKAIEIMPDYQYAYMSRGDSKHMIGDFKGAIKDYNMSISLSPYATTYYSRGIAKYNIEEYKEAADDFTKAIGLCDEAQKIWDGEHQKEYAKLNSKNRKAAMAKAGREIEHEPMYAGSFAKRGSAKMKLGNLPEALTDYNRAIEIDPKSGEYYYTRGLIHFVQGNKSGGCTDLNTAVELGYAAAAELVKKYCQ